MLSQSDLDELMRGAAQRYNYKISSTGLYGIKEDIGRNYVVDGDTLFLDWLALNEPLEVYIFVFNVGESSEMERGNTKTLYEILREFYENPDDVYDIINFSDSTDREYLFTAFEDVFGIDYDDSYEWWLHSKSDAGERIASKLKVSDSRRQVKDSAVDIEDAVYNAIMQASPAVQDAIVEIARDNYDLSEFESTEDLSNTIWNDIDYLVSQLPEDLQEDFADSYGF